MPFPDPNSNRSRRKQEILEQLNAPGLFSPRQRADLEAKLDRMRSKPQRSTERSTGKQPAQFRSAIRFAAKLLMERKQIDRAEYERRKAMHLSEFGHHPYATLGPIIQAAEEEYGIAGN